MPAARNIIARLNFKPLPRDTFCSLSPYILCQYRFDKFLVNLSNCHPIGALFTPREENDIKSDVWLATSSAPYSQRQLTFENATPKNNQQPHSPPWPLFFIFFQAALQESSTCIRTVRVCTRTSTSNSALVIKAHYFPTLSFNLFCISLTRSSQFDRQLFNRLTPLTAWNEKSVVVLTVSARPLVGSARTSASRSMFG